MTFWVAIVFTINFFKIFRNFTTKKLTIKYSNDYLVGDSIRDIRYIRFESVKRRVGLQTVYGVKMTENFIGTRFVNIFSIP